MGKSFKSDQFQSALKKCRVHFVASFWLQGLVSLSALVYPVYMIQVYGRVIPSQNIASLIALLTGAVIVLVFSGIYSFLQRILLARASLRLDRLLASETFRALITRSSAEQNETGAQLLRDLSIARNYFTKTGPEALVSGPWTALFLGVLFVIDFFVGAISLAFLVVEALLSIWQLRLTRQARESTVQAGITSQRMVEANIRSADAIVAMGMLPGLVRKWRTIDDRAIAAEARGGYITAAFGAVSSSLSIVMTVSIMSVAAIAAIEGILPAGFVFAATLAFGMMMRPMRSVLKAWEGYDEASAATTRVNLLLSRYERSGSSLELPRPNGALGVRNVYYAQPGNQKPLLVNVTFGILPGTTVGLLGAIGSGKTTLVRLLVGLLPPSRGEIRLDGAEISEWDRDHLGRHIGYLPQEISLVSGTVAENIGRLGLFDEAQIVQAAIRASVHNIILKLPQGYDTVIGDGGLRLSGGQKQLIGLARAVIGRPSFVVLDEPNSNLDGPGENALAKCIADLKQSGCTVIMVSHRPGLVQNLDRILLLRDGAIAFDGPVDRFFEASGRPSIRLVKQGKTN